MNARRLCPYYCDLKLNDNQVNLHKVVPYLLRELQRSFHNGPIVELVVLPVVPVFSLAFVALVLRESVLTVEFPRPPRPRQTWASSWAKVNNWPLIVCRVLTKISGAILSTSEKPRNSSSSSSWWLLSFTIELKTVSPPSSSNAEMRNLR